jgi:hypothetical protein
MGDADKSQNKKAGDDQDDYDGALLHHRSSFGEVCRNGVPSLSGNYTKWIEMQI